MEEENKNTPPINPQNEGEKLSEPQSSDKGTSASSSEAENKETNDINTGSNPSNDEGPQVPPVTPENKPETSSESTVDLPVAAPSEVVPVPNQDVEVFSPNRVDVAPVQNLTDKVMREVAKVVVGQEDMVELILIATLCGGHCLLEGLPGIAKTLTTKSLAKAIDVPFSRIQFTPDLMPTDVSGTTVFNLKDSSFNFKKGPIFSSFILIDEINRAPAKTQAALMEVMEEKQLTYDGVTYEMPFPFFVMATQNPIEQEGTYALPEAQLDRFIFRLKVGYPDLQDEERILQLFQDDFFMTKDEEIKAVASASEIKDCQKIIEQVYIKPQLIKYIANIIHNTRNNGDIYLGASPRASLAIMRTSKTAAALSGRDFVTPDDIQRVCPHILNHRILLSHEREMEGVTAEEIIADILKTIEVPR